MNKSLECTLYEKIRSLSSLEFLALKCAPANIQWRTEPRDDFEKKNSKVRGNSGREGKYLGLNERVAYFVTSGPEKPSRHASL